MKTPLIKVLAIMLAVISLIIISPATALASNSAGQNVYMRSGTVGTGSKLIIASATDILTSKLTSRGLGVGSSTRFLGTLRISKDDYSSVWTYKNAHLYSPTLDAYVARSGNLLLLTRDEGLALTVVIALDGAVSLFDGKTHLYVNINNDAGVFYIADSVSETALTAYVELNLSASDTKDGGAEEPEPTPTNTVYVSGISLTPDTVSVKVGNSVAVAAEVLPETATNKALTWHSSNKDIATVDENGLITGVAAGEVVITATAQDLGVISANANVTVTPKTYTVTFLDIDNSVLKSYDVEQSGTAIPPEIPEHAGYSFSGWDSDFSCVTDDLTVRSLWTLREYTITYTLNGGEFAVTPITQYNITTQTFELPVPNRSGYSFIGWYTDEACAGVIQTEVALGTVGNLCFYAAWDLCTYSITYELNGGTFPQGVTQISSYTSETDTFKLSVPTMTGYAFSGWYTSSDCFGSPIYEVAKGTVGNLTLFAAWSVTPYHITYELYGGAFDSTPVTEYTVDTPTFDLTVPTRIGHNFGGWYTDVLYLGDAVTQVTTGTTGDLTFHAKWVPVVYTIAYELNGGGFNESPITSYTINTPTFALPVPVKAGYRFIGWYANAAFGGEATEIINGGTMGNLFFYARWEMIEYTITYHMNNGAFSSPVPERYTVETPTFTLQIPKRLGYTFGGWFTDENFPGNPIIKVMQGTTGNLNLYALFTAIEYSITYELNGGMFYETPATSFTVETTTFFLPIPSKNGYTFSGWYTNAQCTGTPITELPCGTLGDKVFFASWTPIVYTITYNLNGGEFTSAVVRQYTIESAEFSLTTPTRLGYTFSGWYKNADFSGNAIAEAGGGTTGELNLFARWTVINYIIAYELNGGNALIGAITVYNIESPVIYLPLATRRGYSFTGWYDNAAFSGEAYTEILSGSVGNKKFFAKWEYVRYSISYELYGGANPANAPSGYNIDSQLTLPTPVRMGYEFLGWYTNAQFSGSVVSAINSGTIGNLMFYAKWGIITYRITYQLNGGVNPTNAPSAYNVLTGAVTLPVPTRVGYEFLGWYDDADCVGNAISVITAGSVGNKTFFAKWTPVVYSLTYYLNGGTPQSPLTTSYTIESADILLQGLTKRGYTFLGWYDNATFSGNAITIIPKGSTGDRTYYAKWVLTTYSITYVLNNGSNPFDAPKNYTMESAQITLPIPTRAGYNFMGWYTTPNLSGQAITTISHGSVGDVTVYAKWTAIVYTITYITNGGIIQPMFVTSYTIESVAVVLIPTTKRGYVFAGWYDNAQLTGAVVNSIPTGSMGNITLYASWEAAVYSITYVLNSGSNPDTAPKSYTIESGAILPVPQRIGYTFSGWYDNAEYAGAKISEIATGTVGNKTFYAKWSLITYTVDYVTNGGILPQDTTYTYTIVSDMFMLPIPARAGYDFTGWYRNSSLTGEQVRSIASGSYGDKTFFAGWTPTLYTITYVVFDGTMPGEYIQSYTIESGAITLPRPTLTGHVFVGWYCNADFSGVPVFSIEAGSLGNRTYYANWRKLIYTIRFFDWDGSTLIDTLYAPYGSDIATAPEPPEHYGYNFISWDKDLTFIASNMDVTAQYELKQYGVVFVDIDYYILSTQLVTHGESAVAPEPPVHEGSVFVFWSCDYSCVESDLVVVAIFRATSITPSPGYAYRFARANGLSSGDKYIFAVNGEKTVALSVLDRLNGSGLWGLEVLIGTRSVRTVSPQGNAQDAVFELTGTDEYGYTLLAEQTGVHVVCQSGNFTTQGVTTGSGDSFAYIKKDSAYYLYDKTVGAYMSLADDGYFEPVSMLTDATPIQAYKMITITASYSQCYEPTLGKNYTVVAITENGAYAMTDTPCQGGIVGIPVEVTDGKMYYMDNASERALAYRFVFGNNTKGFTVRSSQNGLMLCSDKDAPAFTDIEDANGLWVYTPSEDGQYRALLDYITYRYLSCVDGVFVMTDTPDCELVLFERVPVSGRMGDVNSDGVVNTGDATLLLKYSINAVVLSDERLQRGDTNGDGTVNTGDTTKLLRYVIGLEDWLG